MLKRTAIRTLLALACLAPLSLVHAQNTPDQIDGVKRVSAEEALKLQQSGAVLVDTRVATEFAERTIKGAQHILYRERSAKSTDFDATQDSFDLAKLPADKSAAVVMFCNSGTCWRSYKAAVVTHRAGYKNVYWLRGGMPEWVSKGLPTQ
jgi:rhodanese-related sulfurtransferase